MMSEPDWSQIDATEEQVKAWMREQITSNAVARLLAGEPDTVAPRLAWEAHNHFHRPFHIRVLHKWAIDIIGEIDG
jgi:hypothetical protein